MANKNEPPQTSGSGAYKQEVMQPDYFVQIKCQLPHQKKDEIAKRRFVYCWERKTKDSPWGNIGLLMTDDDGYLFKLEDFFKEKTKNNDITKWKTDKYNHSSKEWESVPWCLFGDSSDILAFQKWVGIEGLASQTYKNNTFTDISKDPDILISITGELDPIFPTHFICEDKYLVKFSTLKEYFITFCPPDIVVQTLPSTGTSTPKNATSTFDFKFWPKPDDSYFDAKYYVFEDEKLSDIEKTYGVTLKEINPGIKSKTASIPKGTAVNLPGILKYKGVLLDIECDYRYADWEYSLRKGAADGKPIRNCSYCSVVLPVNMEELLSNLSYHTTLLDILYMQVLDSGYQFFDAAAKVKRIAMLSDVMCRYPGYNTRRLRGASIPGPVIAAGSYHIPMLNEQNSPTIGAQENVEVEYSDKITVPGDKLKDANDLFNKLYDFNFKMIEAALTHENPVVDRVYDMIVRSVDVIKNIYLSKDLLSQTSQWIGYLLYSKEHVPFNIRNAIVFPLERNNTDSPVLFKIVRDAAIVAMSIEIPVVNSTSAGTTQSSSEISGDTIGKKFYEDVVAHLDSFLENIFLRYDIQNKISAHFLKELQNETCPLVDKSLKADGFLKTKQITKLDSDKSLFSKIFGSIIFNQIVPNIWHNTEGDFTDSYMTAIIKFASRHRHEVYTLSQAETTTKGIIDANTTFVSYRTEIGKLIITGHKQKEILEVTERVVKSHREIRNVEELIPRDQLQFSRNLTGVYKRAKNWIAGKYYRIIGDDLNSTHVKTVTPKEFISSHETVKNYDPITKSIKDLSQAPRMVSNLFSVIGAGLAFIDIAEFCDKVASGKNMADDDYLNFAKAIVSGGVFATGINISWLNKYNIFLKSTKVLGTGTALLFWLDTITYSIELYKDFHNEDFIMNSLRIGRVVTTFTAAVLTTTAVFVPAIAEAVWLGPVMAGLVVTTIVITITIDAYVEIRDNGMAHVIKGIQGELNDHSVFKGDIITSNYINRINILNSLNLIFIEKASYNYKPKVLSNWSVLNKLIDNLRPWNLDIIKAGAVLYGLGYTFEDIGYICMEIPRTTGLQKDEKEYIELFKTKKTFNYCFGSIDSQEKIQDEIKNNPGYDTYKDCLVNNGKVWKLKKVAQTKPASSNSTGAANAVAK
jgi:hypothetical protein